MRLRCAVKRRVMIVQILLTMHCLWVASCIHKRDDNGLNPDLSTIGTRGTAYHPQPVRPVLGYPPLGDPRGRGELHSQLRPIAETGLPQVRKNESLKVRTGECLIFCMPTNGTMVLHFIGGDLSVALL